MSTHLVGTESVNTEEQSVHHTYTVHGMTCGHCVMSVTEEISTIDGVTDVAVDLPTGAVAVTSDRPLDEAQVRTAVEEAGYAIV